ncbi:NBS-LRR protein [Artemisia annua]|uniref:NBS-LRR protein n=1 Tax=Artemisia annua TaxID=35608 RepID=A0A2U1P5R6_ARTAN|nr:NBS-LRR protein [Artemisia annua]
MADPIISALVEDLVGRLTSAAIQEYGLLRGLEKDLSALNKTFELIQAVLYDAEEKQKTQMDVEVWLKTLKSASLEVENVLDEAKTEAMIRRLHREMGKKYRIRAFFSYRYNPVMVRFRIAHKVKNIRKQLEDIDANRSRFQLISNTRSEDGAGIGSKRETSSLMPLTHFDLKCWVYVSSVFDVKRIIKAICGLEDKKLDEMSLDELMRQLQNKLEGKKYVIIMDDVWLNHDSHEDMEKWEELCTALSCGAKGSTVMVTTRKEDLAKRVAIPELLHNVGVLSEKDSWSIFKMLAFPVRGVGENSLGSLMSTKETVEKWQRVNKNFKLNIQDNVLTALRLSYDDLPPHMKICFAYCCVFSKGEELSKDTLIELWIANGFIPSQGDASLYELGEDIFDCLVGRSFFQDVVEKNLYIGETCKMHDLMLDLARNVMTHDCAVIGPGKEPIIPDKVLHLSISCEAFEFSNQYLKNLRSVRSMLVFDMFYQSSIRQISSHVYLRVLYLNRIESLTLPESICKLIHLRYLKIYWSKIEVLPESIIYLQNLQTLILEGCDELRELPKGLRYMRNLQRLDVGYFNKLKHMPVGIKELTNLRRLSKFAVGRDKGARIGELGNMNLVGKLMLSGLENVGGLREAESANLKDKTNLKSLTLQWTDDERSETNDSEVEGLEPNSGLQELIIQKYMGRVISPSWLVKLVNLTSIQFYEVNKCEQLPPLGKLPSLKRIQLYNMNSLKCFDDHDTATSKDEILFPSLQELEICFCWSLVSLPNNFPKLQSLKIEDCHKLGSLPDEIQSFKDLNQIAIWRCAILSRRCEKGIGEDWPKIFHIPHIDIQPPL